VFSYSRLPRAHAKLQGHCHAPWARRAARQHYCAATSSGRRHSAL